MKASRILTALLILLAGGSALYLLLGGGQGGAATAVITSGEREIDEIDLNQADEPYTLRVETEAGGYNLIEVEHGRIRVAEADCPDQVCVRQGWIADGAVPIVCLPNQLIIQITEEGDVDGLAG